MARPLRTAVVGAGAISLEHLPFLSTSPRCELASIVDLSPVSAEIAARKFGAKSHYVDVDEMLDKERPDVVHVLTPPQTHGFLVSKALNAGAHVICEKPLSPTAEEAEKLLAEAAAAGRHLIENHNYRFNDEVLALRSVIDEGRIGPVREVDIRMALPVRDPGGRFADTNVPNSIHQMPAGVLHDFITHLSYLMIDLAGVSHFERVMAAMSNHGAGDLFSFDDLDAILISKADVPGPETDETPVHGRIRFSCRTSPDLFSLTVRGADGQASTDIFHPFLDVVVDRSGGQQLTPIVNHLVNGVGLARSGARNFGRKLLQHTPYHGLTRFLDQTYAALGADREPPVTAADVLAAARLVDAIVASSALQDSGRSAHTHQESGR